MLVLAFSVHHFRSGSLWGAVLQQHPCYSPWDMRCCKAPALQEEGAWLSSGHGVAGWDLLHSLSELAWDWPGVYSGNKRCSESMCQAFCYFHLLAQWLVVSHEMEGVNSSPSSLQDYQVVCKSLEKVLLLTLPPPYVFAMQALSVPFCLEGLSLSARERTMQSISSTRLLQKQNHNHRQLETLQPENAKSCEFSCHCGEVAAQSKFPSLWFWTWRLYSLLGGRIGFGSLSCQGTEFIAPLFRWNGTQDEMDICSAFSHPMGGMSGSYGGCTEQQHWVVKLFLAPPHFIFFGFTMCQPLFVAHRDLGYKALR